MTIFEADDYKSWVNARILTMPKRGRGQYARLAETLNTNSAVIAQVFKGDRDLTADQAVLLAEYWGLTKLERQFLILLVNHSRAGSVRYKHVLEEEREVLRRQARDLKSRVHQTKELTEEAKAVLYSNWYYLAIWSLTAIPGFDNVDSLAQRLGLSRSKVSQALALLLKHGLVVESKGRLKIGPTLLHLEADSPLSSRQHQNWRLKAFQRYESQTESEFFYTAPVTLSERDVARLREKVMQFVAESVDLIKDSPSEKLYCFCLDWFEVR